MSVFVTKPYLPPREEYLARVSAIFDRDVLTNQGPEVRELEARLRAFLGVEHLQYLANGTLALQLALRALDITEGEVITTPFSYVATTSAILWERCTPVFVDIEPDTFTLDAAKIEEAVTPRTKAVMPVHVFGRACDTDAIEAVAAKHGLKVIYDAAHAFASRWKGRSLCSCGDVSTLSFHATKLFHTVEGGACVMRDAETAGRLDLVKRFGHHGDTHHLPGTNAKQGELHAAMGLVNLCHIDEIVAERKAVSEMYDSLLGQRLQRPAPQEGLEYNYAYYPVLFEDERELLEAFGRLHRMDVFPRRYFYPSLDTLPYVESRFPCPVSEDVSRRIACLPLFCGLGEDTVERICHAL